MISVSQNHKEPLREFVTPNFMVSKFINSVSAGQFINRAADASITDESSILNAEISDIMIKYYFSIHRAFVFLI